MLAKASLACVLGETGVPALHWLLEDGCPGELAEGAEDAMVSCEGGPSHGDAAADAFPGSDAVLGEAIGKTTADAMGTMGSACDNDETAAAAMGGEAMGGTTTCPAAALGSAGDGVGTNGGGGPLA
jgi:hypothetical protein